MNGMQALESLRGSLGAINARFALPPFGQPKEMERTASQLEKKFGYGRSPNPELIQKTLELFSRTGHLTSYRDIKCVCYGFLVPFLGNRTIAGNPDTTHALFVIVDRYKKDPKKLKRCFQALYSAYLDMDSYDSKSSTHQEWEALRHRLSDWLPKLQDVSPKPDWLAAVEEHRNLLGADPTKRYGAAILRGQSSDFDSACSRLNVSRYSWVRRRAILSSVEAASNENDSKFHGHLENLIAVLKSNPGVRDEGAAQLLNRYAKQATTPEHMPLRAFSIEVFGNPLITANKSRWFEVSVEARKMVSNWLKGFLIERFFDLLSHDGRTDRRRPKFWIRHRDSIENMWFILGATAMSSWNDDFRKLRETMGNQCLSLEGATTGNNAFVMKIGPLYVVEFGEKGNATYIFDHESLPFDLAVKKFIYLNMLKSPSHIERLTHMDGKETWEDKFSTALSQYGVHPDDSVRSQMSSAPVRGPVLGEVSTPLNIKQALKEFCNERGLRYDDRAPGGRLVVYADSSNSFVSGKLGQWGFTYKRESRKWVRNP